ncbi:MAG: hypothetical protein ACI8Z9_001819 [Paraglaciecola sp.]|jgi:hypothetical protein
MLSLFAPFHSKKGAERINDPINGSQAKLEWYSGLFFDGRPCFSWPIFVFNVWFNLGLKFAPAQGVIVLEACSDLLGLLREKDVLESFPIGPFTLHFVSA